MFILSPFTFPPHTTYYFNIFFFNNAWKPTGRLSNPRYLNVIFDRFSTKSAFSDNKHDRTLLPGFAGYNRTEQRQRLMIPSFAEPQGSICIPSIYTENGKGTGETFNTHGRGKGKRLKDSIIYNRRSAMSSFGGIGPSGNWHYFG